MEVNTGEDASIKELILEVRQSVESDKKTVENLLIWSKSQFASISAKPQKVQYQRIGGQVLHDLNQSILEKNLELQTYLDHNASVFVDPYHLEIIMRNLLTNAVKLSPKVVAFRWPIRY
ncbi:MAG: hypothetical protein U5L96_21360 [Owenweeksia sp.]|nr:hypothetical protein [Owenweeksia sp.]